jgi:hypothetical protein
MPETVQRSAIRLARAISTNVASSNASTETGSRFCADSYGCSDKIEGSIRTASVAVEFQFHKLRQHTVLGSFSPLPFVEEERHAFAPGNAKVSFARLFRTVTTHPMTATSDRLSYDSERGQPHRRPTQIDLAARRSGTKRSPPHAGGYRLREGFHMLCEPLLRRRCQGNPHGAPIPSASRLPRTGALSRPPKQGRFR